MKSIPSPNKLKKITQRYISNGRVNLLSYSIEIVYSNLENKNSKRFTSTSKPE